MTPALSIFFRATQDGAGYLDIVGHRYGPGIVMLRPGQRLDIFATHNPIVVETSVKVRDTGDESTLWNEVVP